MDNRSGTEHYERSKEPRRVEQFKPGDRVYVDDPGLAMLRDVMRNATGQEPRPNHQGTVEQVHPAKDGYAEDPADDPYRQPRITR